jgi:hypothetical protein
MSKIIVSMSGWCEANPEKVKFMYVGPEQYGLMSTGGTITGTEWLALPENDRGDYILECIESAFETAFDGEYNDIDIEVEE